MGKRLCTSTSALARDRLVFGQRASGDFDSIHHHCTKLAPLQSSPSQLCSKLQFGCFAPPSQCFCGIRINAVLTHAGPGARGGDRDSRPNEADWSLAVRMPPTSGGSGDYSRSSHFDLTILRYPGCQDGEQYQNIILVQGLGCATVFKYKMAAILSHSTLDNSTSNHQYCIVLLAPLTRNLEARPRKSGRQTQPACRLHPLSNPDPLERTVRSCPVLASAS